MKHPEIVKGYVALFAYSSELFVLEILRKNELRYLIHLEIIDIVIENEIDDYWINKRVCNCFAFMTIPIYLGSSKIGVF